jgi:hypothetical protein
VIGNLLHSSTGVPTSLLSPEFTIISVSRKQKAMHSPLNHHTHTHFFGFLFASENKIAA